MQLARFLYIARRWKEDEVTLGQMIDHLSQDNPERPFQIVLFPEGTNLTPKTKAKSDSFAKENNLKPYNHVLHPRTTGFSYIVEKLRESECSKSTMQ